MSSASGTEQPSTSPPTQPTKIPKDAVFVPSNVGHLLQGPTEIVCPSCQRECLTRVEYDVVTLMQKLATAVSFSVCCNTLRWDGRRDINHYCSNCGCYIGRYISMTWFKRQLMKVQHDEVAEQDRWQRVKKIEKEQANKTKASQSQSMRK